MKKVYKKIISFSISLLLVIGIIIEFRFFIDMNKLFANINEYTQDESISLSDESISLYKAYSPGDIIYFDPVSDGECNESTFDINKVNSNESTCYKWRVISSNDSSINETINIQLDHNIALTDWITNREINTNYSGRTLNSVGPKTALTSLSNKTDSWTKVPLLNYTYDTNNVGDDTYWTNRSHYKGLSCIDGVCKNGNDEVLSSNVRARLITVEEVQNIANKLEPNFQTNSQSINSVLSWQKTSPIDYNGYYFSSQSNLNDKRLSWLVENTDETMDSGATYTCTTYPIYDNYHNCRGSYGYWTLTPVAQSNAQVWSVYNNGNISALNAGLYENESRYGIRPVIEYKKERLNYLVVYNDEGRITNKVVSAGGTTQNILSQGKEGYTFKYWSTDKNTPFDFNQEINENITLYAVYEINKYEVEFYDNNEKLKTLTVEYNNLINQNDIPTTKEKYEYWMDEEENEFNFETRIVKNYKLYAKHKQCNLSIKSNVYLIDNDKLLINNVPSNASKEEITNNLQIEADIKEIKDDEVIIKCDDDEKVYKIKRLWIPQTGNILIDYTSILGYTALIVLLLFEINKQRIINKRLRK